MIWLIGLVLLLQAIFHWAFEPLIRFSSPILEARGLGVLILIVLVWAFSAKGR